MIGNDVVDLADPETLASGLHPRFDARVFAPAEREALAASERPDRARWILWAAKESAYKAARRACARTVFSPRRFRVALDGGLNVAVGGHRGSVTHDGRRYPLRIEIDGDCVHAIVTDPTPDDDAISFWSVGRLTAAQRRDPGAAVRALAGAAIEQWLDLPRADIQIERRGRVPQLVARGVTPDAAPGVLSLSHHGDYAGFACCLRRAESVQ